MADTAPLEARSGFRRRFVVTPEKACVTAAVEDDYHCMAVTLHHEDGVVRAVEPVMDRVPWTTCPGALAVLRDTFEGVPLNGAAKRGEKQANCTHLHDLATLAAAHAGDTARTVFDIYASDGGKGDLIEAELRRDGEIVLAWSHIDDVMQSPEAIAGVSLFALRDWIATLDPSAKEAARLLQWGTLIAHGRAIPLENQSDASRMPSNCFTFQPGRKEHARRVGRIRDFSAQDERAPLGHFDGRHFAEEHR